MSIRQAIQEYRIKNKANPNGILLSENDFKALKETLTIDERVPDCNQHFPFMTVNAYPSPLVFDGEPIPFIK